VAHLPNEADKAEADESWALSLPEEMRNPSRDRPGFLQIEAHFVN